MTNKRYYQNRYFNKENRVDSFLAGVGLFMILSAVFLLLVIAVKYGNAGPDEISAALESIRN